MKGTKIKRARAPLGAMAANDNFSAAFGRGRNRAGGQAAVRQHLRRLVRPILVVGISACVVLVMSGAFLVGIAGIALIAAALAGWHLVRRKGSHSARGHAYRVWPRRNGAV